MIPEAGLVVVLVLIFVTDFIRSGRSCSVPRCRCLANITILLLTAQTILCAITPASEAFSGLYVATAASNVMKVILTLGSLIVVIMAQSWLSKPEVAKREGEFYVLLVATLIGMYVMMSSGHFLMFFLGLEMASVPLGCMVALDKHKKESAEAAAKFILTATFSSGVMLYGISFLYGACGTLYFDDVAAQLSSLAFSQEGFQYYHLSSMPILGLVFFFSGLGFKLSLVPFHFWTADTYQGAPTPVTGYLSVVSKGAAAFALMTILMKVFSPMVEYYEYLLYIVIVLSITIANLFAIRQNELKRFMAFSSISQAGYIMLAAIGSSDTGLTALMYYVLVYVVANMSVFTVINVVETRGNGTTRISCYNGLYKTNPKLAFLMTVALFSLAGIPPFAGMFSKFFVFMAAAQQGSFLAYIVVLVALVNTVVSLYYYLLIVKAMYITPEDNPMPAFSADCGTKTALAICTVGIVLFGIVSCVYNWLSAAACA